MRKKTIASIRCFSVAIMFAMVTLFGFASGVVTNVTARQIRPWRGLVEIKYELTADVKPSSSYSVITQKVTVVDNVHGTHCEARTFTREPTFTKGKHQLIWNAKADGCSFDSNSVEFSVSIEELVLRYCVVDLSGGTTAVSYPVSYLTAMPSGGWTDEYKTDKLVLRLIEAGSFIMGENQSSESCRVTLTKPFYMGVFEVTQRQWELVMGSNPSYFSFSGNPNLPVEGLSYTAIRGDSLGSQWPASNSVDANSFLGKIRERSGIDFDLPTEAQWEYACRAGTTTTYSYGNSVNGAYMWYGANSGSSTHDVGMKLSNPWGLYDMHGNVTEWTLDWYSSSLSYGDDPKGSSSQGHRVIRGGAWGGDANWCTSFSRSFSNPVASVYGAGCRISWTLLK